MLSTTIILIEKSDKQDDNGGNNNKKAKTVEVYSAQIRHESRDVNFSRRRTTTQR